MGGVTGGVRLPLLWRGGVDTFPRDTELDRVSDSLGWIFLLRDSCSRRAASVMNLQQVWKVSHVGYKETMVYRLSRRCSSPGTGSAISQSHSSSPLARQWSNP